MMVVTTQDISVVICAFTEERWDYLMAAIESIQKQSILPCEIILVIDHNKQLFERARTCLSGVIVIENSEPKGSSGARNNGIALSHGPLVAFLDDDAVAEPDWLERLNRCCQNPEVLGAGGVVEPLWSGQQPEWFPKEFYWVIGCTYQSLPEGPVAVRNTYEGCTCIRREVFEVVGGFMNGLGRVGTYPLGGEAAELCIRATQRWPHRVFLCDPHARIFHHVSLHRASWRYFMLRCYAEGLSKAKVSRYVGSRDSLSSERKYAYKTLPKGILRSLQDLFVRRDLTGLLRAGAIIIGLLMTTIGYLVASVSRYLPLFKEGITDMNFTRTVPFEHYPQASRGK